MVRKTIVNTLTVTARTSTQTTISVRTCITIVKTIKPRKNTERTDDESDVDDGLDPDFNLNENKEKTTKSRNLTLSKYVRVYSTARKIKTTYQMDGLKETGVQQPQKAQNLRYMWNFGGRHGEASDNRT
ncbi:hypothetical protein KP79_PYT20323 [Mizuhopecten yessoensis]|uniref:Uncharacterized protein n=1 Tax=Mizuhopecten yessoensis TaxID=6573 RepID=A0A210PRT1_MIZYE|nr:hypothetical protein KP79_PYT20323 [Mizuhopecten yessoensis]